MNTDEQVAARPGDVVMVRAEATRSIVLDPYGPHGPGVDVGAGYCVPVTLIRADAPDVYDAPRLVVSEDLHAAGPQQPG